MLTSNADSADPARLAELLAMSEGNDALWRPEELAAILRHQLAAPIEYDLTAMDRSKARKLSANAASRVWPYFLALGGWT